jgi:hypothetical protein
MDTGLRRHDIEELIDEANLKKRDARQSQSMQEARGRALG